MTVQRFMTPDPVTIDGEASIEEATRLLKENNIRHLPVVRDGKLVGWLTDANLRGVIFAAMLEELKVEDVMIHDPISLDPSASIEDAARVIVQERIGGMPVVKNGKVVGVITVIDFLNAFLEMMGILRESSRIDVEPARIPEALETISAIIRREHGEIISVCLLPRSSHEKAKYSFRLTRCNVKPIVDAIEREGHRVVSYEKS